MLRTDNGRALEHSTNIRYEKVGNNCLKSGRKSKCHSGLTDLEKMRNFHRQNACATYSCVPLKKCHAKVGMHANGEYMTAEFIGKNMTRNLRVGGNQIGYVYQEKTLVDDNALMNALQRGEVAHNTATKLAQHNAELYGKDTNWDGTSSGYFCVKCPPRKLPCPSGPKCKKADPFNAPIGLGSDVIQATDTLRENALASVFRQREATPTKAMIPTVMGEKIPPQEMDSKQAGGPMGER